MNKIMYLVMAGAILLGGCKNDVQMPSAKLDERPIEIKGRIDRAAMDKEKSFFLYALLSPGEEWKSFCINRDKATLKTDGMIQTEETYLWPQDDNMYRFIGVMNAADQSSPVVDMDGPVIKLNAGDSPESDLLLSNNLKMRRSSTDREMGFRHVMTQVVFKMVVDDPGEESYKLTGRMKAGKLSATYGALALPKVDLATVAEGAEDYMVDIELSTSATERSPHKVYYLIPDGSDLTALADVKMNGLDETDFPLISHDGEGNDIPVSLRSGHSYTVTLHVSKGVVSATVSLGSWLEEDLGDRIADVAPSTVVWDVSYPEGFDRITKVEVVDEADRLYFATLDADGKTTSPMNLPSVPKKLAVWLGNLRVVLRESDYTFVDKRLEIGVVFVGSAEKLAAIATDRNTRRYRQVANIDLKGQHTPVGNSTTPFVGEYDGAGCLITNLGFNTPNTESGLFGRNGGTIKNVTIAKTSVEDMRGSSGLVCGVNTAAGTIENCVNHANFASSTNTDSPRVGGIVGVNNGRISNCKNYGRGTSSYNHLGGVCGQSSGNAVVVEACHNYGDMFQLTAGNYLGGIAGSIMNGGKIAGCANRGLVKGNKSFVGGIAGYCYATIENSKNYGDVTGAADDIGGITGFLNTTGAMLSGDENFGKITSTAGKHVGGIAGLAAEPSTITDCTNNGEVSTALRGGGIAGAAEKKSNIKRSVNKGVVICVTAGENRNMGGIVGSANDVTLAENVNVAPVTSAGQQTGGIVGNSTNVTIIRCINTGTVTGYSRLGGITAGASLGTTTITACLNSGDVSATDASGYVAGIAPYSGAAAKFTACVNMGRVSGQQMAGGIVGYLNGAQAAVNSCYSVGDIVYSGTNARFGAICAYQNAATASIVSSFWNGNLSNARGEVGKGVGHIQAGPADTTLKFSETDWPTEDTGDGWKLVGNGGLWESLGAWDAANPLYPTLAGLPQVPAP